MGFIWKKDRQFGYVVVNGVRVTHICVDKLAIIGSDNDFSPGRRQVII